VQLAAERARQDRDRQQLHLENLRRQSFQSEAAAEAIPAAETALADQEKRLQERLAEVERLTIRSPRSGVLLAPPSQSAEQHMNDLGQWTGTPLEPRNVGANLATGTLVGLIGNPKQLEATLLVEQGEITLVRPGQQVSLRMNLNPGQVLDGEIVDLSPSRVDELPRELVAVADIPQKTDSQGRPMPLGKIYQARVKLTGTAVPLVIGAVGRARILVAPQSLIERFGRFLSSTFRVDW
jgi:putative peptide zinc metalloprotease protein